MKRFLWISISELLDIGTVVGSAELEEGRTSHPSTRTPPDPRTTINALGRFSRQFLECIDLKRTFLSWNISFACKGLTEE